MSLFGFMFKAGQNEFYRLLIDHARIVYETYRVLEKFLLSPDLDEDLARTIHDNEREADDLRRILIEKLNKTLITPFDREDIFGVSRDVDDIIDAAKRTVEEIQVFEVRPTDDLVTMVRILEKGSLELHDALKNLREHRSVAKEHAVKAKTAENEMNHVYLKALARVFNEHEDHPGYMLKMREIYRHLNRSSDRCDEAANTILNIIVKME